MKADPSSANLARVAVLVETSTAWGRGIVSGINDYLRHQQHWQVLLEPRGPNSELKLPRQWRGEGIIARVADSAMARSLGRMKMPVVNVSSIQLSGPQFPRVANDVSRVVDTAVEHFRERGFRHFGFFSTQKVHLQEEFESAVREAGFDCSSYVLPPESGMEAGWNLSLNRLKAWLLSLPKPVAILAWGNGRPLIYAGQAAGLSTPEEVAVLTNYFDELVNELSPMPLSGIRIASDRVGFEAAALLDRLLAGAKPPAEPLLIPPNGVVIRQSTSTLAIHDAALARAVSYIRENAAEAISVTDVARQAGLSRCVLERRFRESFHRSPGEEIRRVRLERARQLLVETDLSIPDVAESCGFGSNAYFTDCFNRSQGISPLRYRKLERKR
jgi:LacI family transcriptional regulator